MMLKYELKKVLNKRVNLILLAVTLLLTFVFSCFAIGSFHFVDPSGEVHNGISAVNSLIKDKNRWKGELPPYMIAEIINRVRTKGAEYQSAIDIIFSTSKMLIGESSDYDDYEAIISADPSQVESLYEIYEDNLKEASREYGETPEQVEFLAAQYDKINMPFYYEAADPWDTMFLYATTFSLILIVVIGFLTAGIFAEEFKYKADSVFFSSRYGRSKAVISKIFAGLIIATLVYIIGIGLLSVICFSIMGISGISTLYQFCYPYAIYSVTYGQMYGIIILSGYTAALLAASVSMLIASKTRMMNIAVCIPFILFCVSPFIGRVLPFRTFFSLTPDQLTNIINCAHIPYIYQIGNIVFPQIPFIIVLYAVISLLILPLVYENYHRIIRK